MASVLEEVVPYIPFDPGSRIPFYRQISDGVRDAILSGRLRPDQRLPSTRALARELEISRLPVLNAFEQLFHEGYIEGRTGCGTYVKDTLPGDLEAPRPRDGGLPITRPKLEGAPSASLRAAWSPGTSGILGPFRVSQPALDRFPHKLWGRLVGRHAKRLPVELLAYGDPAGYAPLREAIAQYLRRARAVRCEGAQVIIVSGSQMALQLCASVLLGPGEAVCFENPGYPGAREALTSNGARLIPVPVDAAGIDVPALVDHGRKACAAYVTPSHQYPLGSSLTAERRLGLLRWARRNRAWILEDDYDSEYRYASRPLGALQGMDESASRVIYIGSFSKVLFPSLRVGYLIVPPAVAGAFVRAREALDIFSPTLFQAVLNEFLRDGHFARHVRRMRAVYHGRRDALLASLGRHVGDRLAVGNAEAGLHLSAFLPEGIDDVEVVRRMERRGITATALSTCYAGRRSRAGLILGFGGSDEEAIDRAAQTMGDALREIAPQVSS